ncbi:MAG TPA: 23S rRNA (adenine(2503)-C(2))-methyltransferase RlmN [bacterium]|nr:23S rRNA (adenine(2503)-C(2))-methyltransferase RlmN [bacterium]
MDNIKDYTLPALAEWLGSQGEKPFRARQIFQWLYQHKATDFAQMSSLSKDMRATLAGHFHIGNLEPVAQAESADGSVKFAFALPDGRQIETVLMPNLTHYTVCVSTQVGCAMGCDFCATAKMGLVRNLSPGEIVQQVVEAARAITGDKFVRNVVFMGMGEPLHNFDNLKAALEILQEDHGFGLSSRRLTVSTSGLVSGIRRYVREGLRANLAVSLNGVDDAVRSRLMPVNRRWNIEALLDACREVPSENRYRITFEYVLLDGLTDGLEAAHKLVRLLHGFKCKVNLIPYNAHPGSPYRPPTLAHAHAFQRILLDRGVLATIRISKGQDIQAACGQLARSTSAALPEIASDAVAAAG